MAKHFDDAELIALLVRPTVGVKKYVVGVDEGVTAVGTLPRRNEMLSTRFKLQREMLIFNDLDAAICFLDLAPHRCVERDVKTAGRQVELDQRRARASL